MIVLSAGHYPEAPGASYGGRTEHQEAVRWVERIANLIRSACPVAVVPTGNIVQKVAWIRERHRVAPIKLAAEIHFNAPPEAGSGCETLHYPGSERGMVAAQIVQAALAHFFEPNRGVKEGWYRQDHPGVQEWSGDVEGDEVILYWLRATPCPAIILEPAFIHQHDDLDKWWVGACDAIAAALIRVVSMP